jgi:hypothetical protein
LIDCIERGQRGKNIELRSYRFLTSITELAIITTADSPRKNISILNPLFGVFAWVEPEPPAIVVVLVVVTKVVVLQVILGVDVEHT